MSEVTKQAKATVRYLVTMTIDIEKAPVNAPAKEPVAAAMPQEPKPTTALPSSQLVYGIKDVTKILGIGRTSVYFLMKEGKLRYVKLGRRTLVTVKELQAFLERIQTS